MPMYEFHCRSCGSDYEELCGSDEAVPCPKCGSAETERLMSTCCCQTENGMSGSSSAGSGDCAGCTSHNCSACRCH